MTRIKPEQEEEDKRGRNTGRNVPRSWLSTAVPTPTPVHARGQARVFTEETEGHQLCVRGICRIIKQKTTVCRCTTKDIESDKQPYPVHRRDGKPHAPPTYAILGVSGNESDRSLRAQTIEVDARAWRVE